MKRLRAVLHGLVSLAALAALLGGAPWTLWQWGRLPTINDDWWSQLTESAVSDTAVFGALTVAAWAAWAIFAASVAVEIVAGLRGVRAPRIAVAGPLQHLARTLVIPILILLSLAHNNAALATTDTAALPTRATATAVVVNLDHTGDQPVPTTPESPAETDPADAATVIMVERNDNPWRLAEKHLGDGMRWRELFDLNRGLPQPDGRTWTDPELIMPGWQLHLPTDSPTTTTEDDTAAIEAAPAAIVHVVEPGDTLSGLANRYLGDPDRYPELFAANEGVVQPDGRRLTDPDLIVVGWHLTIPTPPPPQPTPAQPSPEATPAPAPPQQTTPVTTRPPQVTQPAPAPSSTTVPSATDSRSTADTAESRGGTVAMAGIGGAVVLATGLALRLRWLRRRRATRGARQPAVATSPAEHALLTAADEPLVRWAGQHLAAVFRATDRRHLTAGPVAVELSDDAGIEILWDAPQHADPPSPWTVADGGWAWRLAYDPDAPVPADELPAAVPALVTIGRRDGRQLLIDLEAFGTMTVDGPSEHTGAYATSIALELACGNDLADAYVTTIGVEIDAAVAPRHRLTLASTGPATDHLTDAARSIGDVLGHDDTVDTFRARCGDTAPIEATVVVACGITAEQPTALSDPISTRHGVALVACGSPRQSSGAHIDIDPTGHSARLEPLGIDFEPVAVPAATVDKLYGAVYALTDLPDDPLLPTAPLVVPSANGDHPATPTSHAPVPVLAGRNGDHTTLNVAAGPLADSDGNVETLRVPASVDAGGSADENSGQLRELAGQPGLFETAPGTTNEAALIVRVLGVPRIDERSDIPRRELILAVLLACRAGALAASAVQDALWGGKPIEAKTMWNFVGKVRHSLGTFPDGSPVMPGADRARGQLRLDERVTTDLAVLRRAFTDADGASSSEAVRALRDALRLIEGPPFDAPGYDWAHRDQDVADAAAVIEQAVDRLVDLALDAGQLDIAREAIIRGLRGLPGDEHLYRTRMRVESASGNHAGIVAAYDELTVYLADLDTQPSPVTTAYYHELIGHRGQPGSAVR